MGGNGIAYLGPLRGPSSREELEIQWSYPVYTAPVVERDPNRSIAVESKRALPMSEAFAQIAGDDPRPLLVLRECLTCTGTDDALLTRQSDNEKTMLMSRWFRCVKLPPAVIEDDHPFHALFAGDDPPHLFVAQANGEMRADLKGDQSRTELWGKMESVLAASYANKHVKALKSIASLLDEFDAYDREFAELNAKLAKELEKRGPKSSKVKKIQKEIDKLAGQKEELKRELAEAAQIPIKKAETAAAATSTDDAA